VNVEWVYKLEFAREGTRKAGGDGLSCVFRIKLHVCIMSFYSLLFSPFFCDAKCNSCGDGDGWDV
jgi:hypothetical protein